MRAENKGEANNWEPKYQPLLQRAARALELLQRPPEPMRPDDLEYYMNPESMPTRGRLPQAALNVWEAMGAMDPGPIQLHTAANPIAGIPEMNAEYLLGLPAIGSIKKNMFPTQLEAAIAKGALKEPSFVSRLFHGTNSEFDKFDLKKTGPVASFTDSPSTAKSYAGGFGGQRRRPKIQEQIFYNENDGLLYEHRGTPGKTEWFEPVGKLDTSKPWAEPTPDNILPIPPTGKKLDWHEFKELNDEGIVQPFDKTARVLQKDFGDLKLLDTRTKGALEEIADQKPVSYIGKILTDAAKKDLKDPYGRVGSEFGFQFWPITKSGKRHAADIEEFISPLKKSGYDAIYHGDDGHNTFGLFDTGLQKELQKNGKYFDPRLHEELLDRLTQQKISTPPQLKTPAPEESFWEALSKVKPKK